MQEKNYSVKLDIFEGPMDLLTYLVRKNDLDVYNIPISFITEEYLAYIDFMDLLDIDYAAEFLYMAATLAHIKSKMLLPAHESQEGEDEEDPRLEISRPLAEYLQLKEASELLSQRDILEQDTFKREELLTHSDTSQYLTVGIFELVETFRDISANSYEDHHIDFPVNTLSVKDKIDEIVLLLEINNPITFSDLIKNNYCKNNIIVSFLAVLEMLKLNIIEIKQHIQSGLIRIFYL